MNERRTTVHIAWPSDEERALLRLLTPAEKLAALVAAAEQKARQLAFELHTATAGAVGDGGAGAKEEPTAL